MYPYKTTNKKAQEKKRQMGEGLAVNVCPSVITNHPEV